MPPLDEGSFLYMPTTMPHASIGEALDVLQKQDMAIQRPSPRSNRRWASSAGPRRPLDPAPISMIETVINYKPEYIDRQGRPPCSGSRYDRKPKASSSRDEAGELIPDADGRPYRQVARAHPASRRHLGRDRQGGQVAGHDLRAQSCSPSPPGSSCSRAACGPPWASRSRARTWRRSRRVGLRDRAVPEGGALRRAGRRHRRPHRGQAVPGDRHRPRGHRPLRHSRSARSRT